MEDLNKNQIVLLTLLVSFVTSIATGIMTVSLLQEAPVEVVRNINSIVEKTIERVTPANPTTPAKEVTTIIVKEEDSVINSINKNIKSIVRITEKDPILGTNSFYGIGLIVDKIGLIGADRKTVTIGNVYTAMTSDGIELSLAPQGLDKKTNFILFKATQSDNKDLSGGTVTEKSPYVFVPATFADTEPKLGQTLISLGGDVTNAVSVGRVASLQMKDSIVGTTTTKYLSSIDTDVSTKDIVDGSPLFNLSGDLVGVKLEANVLKSFTPVSILKNELLVLIETPKTP